MDPPDPRWSPLPHPEWGEQSKQANTPVPDEIDDAVLEDAYAAWETAEREHAAWQARTPHLQRALRRAEAFAATVSPAYFSGSQTYRWLQTL